MQRPHALSASATALRMYAPDYPVVLVAALSAYNYSGWAFLRWFWRSDPALKPNGPTVTDRLLSILLAIGMLSEVGLGTLLVYFGVRYRLPGGWEFGLALIVAYPLVWAHVLALTIMASNITRFKATAKTLLCLILEAQVRSLRKKYDFTVVAVAGSVGKTSTKLAIAKVLAANKRVAYQEGNFNDRLTVPLVVFGVDRPRSLYNLSGWAKVMLHNQRVIQKGYPYDIAVVELGTDGPGQIAEFAYLHPDLAVVTAVAPEHMAFFSSLDAVAQEELQVADFSEQLLYNQDDISPRYLRGRGGLTYGLGQAADYRATYKPGAKLAGEQVTFNIRGQAYKAHTAYLGDQGAKVVLAALAVAAILGMDMGQAIAATEKLQPFAGRMQLLLGKHGTTIIDDTYNASPLAVKAALDVLYRASATKRIAILGSMNELGAESQAAHVEVGAYCDPKKLDIVVTIGKDANTYLAPEALKRGCVVTEFLNPNDAGKWVAERLEPGTVVLAKGSQNGVFAEEALKPLLAHSADEAKLVRQSTYWRKQKRRQFPR